MLVNMKSAIVTGAGGFIGHHYVSFLKNKGYDRVIGIDIKYPEFSKTKADEFIITDLRNYAAAKKVFKKVDELYMFAADMGGVGYIQTVHAPIISNNSLININSLNIAKKTGIKNVFFASSACVYPQNMQTNEKISGLKEKDAHPSDPDSPYGWEKLFTEQLAKSFNRDYGIKIHVARFHNIYGPEGTYDGGKEKAPAAICRKVAKAKMNGEINIWGDGKQTRSFCYIDDCCVGVYKLMKSKHLEPINIGSTELISIDKMVDMVSSFDKKKLKKIHDLSKPQGVRGRNSDNTILKKVLKWEPTTSLRDGLKKTYSWISSELK